MAPAERRALLILLGLIVTGHGVRAWILRPGQAPGSVTILQNAGDAALARHRQASERVGRPLSPGERIDLNIAPATELARLPRIGPALARRIAADRDSRGAFQSVEDLRRVTGVGEAILREVREWVEVGGVGSGGWGKGNGMGGSAPVAAGASATPPSTPVSHSPLPLPHSLLNLNTAAEAELLRLPGVGPTKARAIMAYRQSRGPFASVEELLRVPGIGPAVLAGFRDRVTVR